MSRVRQIRLAAGLRQWELAGMLGTTQSAVHKYEHGVVPEPRRLIELARIGAHFVQPDAGDVLDDDVFTDDAAEHRHQARDDIVDVDDGKLHGLTATEGEQSPSEAAAALDQRANGLRAL